MTYFFHPEAEKELNDSIDYYEECKTNLGLEFASEVYQTIQRILTFQRSIFTQITFVKSNI
jgi:hypothetical protein